jgi:hypothetical protein
MRYLLTKRQAHRAAYFLFRRIKQHWKPAGRFPGNTATACDELNNGRHGALPSTASAAEQPQLQEKEENIMSQSLLHNPMPALL